MRFANVAGPLALVLLASSYAQAFPWTSSSGHAIQMQSPTDAGSPDSATGRFQGNSVHTWTFTDATGQIGSGNIYLYDNVLVTRMTGTINGQRITFCPNGPTASFCPLRQWTDVNDPAKGQTTIQNPPNAGGANYTYDDIYVFSGNGSGFTGLDTDGLVFSTGSVRSTTNPLRVYNLFVDSLNNAQADLFSNQTSDEGTFTVN